MNSCERRFYARVLANSFALESATPGFVVQAYEGGRLRLDVRYGKYFPYYDLASLTKIIFSANALAHEFSQDHLHAQDRVVDFWPEFNKDRVTLRQLMTHTAGLPWWRPFYKTYHSGRTPAPRWRELSGRLTQLQLQKSKKAIYSDPDVLVLGQVLTRSTGKNLQGLWRKLVGFGFMGDLHFNIGSKRRRPKSDYAPTEYCPWRKRILQGEVHDENAWALGGIAPHAGLFGRVEDVAHIGLQWRTILHADRRRPISSQVLQQFVRRQVPTSVGDWGWLFMKPTAGKASCGRYFSPSSFGHTGFTGTSLWMDPKKDRMIVLLSNRVHPTRKNAEFVAWRPKLHDWVCESLDG